MKLTIALLLASMPFLAIGGEGLYHAALSRHQTTITCEQLAASPPKTSWLRISGCHIGEDVSFGDADGPIEQLVLPVRRAGQPDSEAAVLVAVTRDPDALTIAQEFLGDRRLPDAEARTVMMLRVVTKLAAAPEIEGYVRRGLLSRARASRLLGSVDTSLAPGAMVLDLNDRPQFVLPGVMAGAGVVLLLAGMVRLLRPAAPARAAAPRASPSAAIARGAVVKGTAAAAPGVGEPRINGVMLLNLEPAAGRDAIEQAPPLGPRDEVEATIVRAIDGMAFDGRGRGVATSERGTVTIDLGSGPVAWTAVLHAQGPGIQQIVGALVAATGWRVYHPKRGTFRGATDLDQL